jgi:chromosome transmission fidelity protein 1
MLSTSLQQLATYYARFRTRLSATHGLHIKRLVVLLKELHSYAGTWQTAAATGGKRAGHMEVLTPSELLERLGQKVASINVLEISRYLRASKLARKINGYAEKAAEKEGELLHDTPLIAT